MVLSNKKIIITRSISQSKDFIEGLEKKGYSSISFPTIEIQEINSKEIDAVFFSLNTFDWIVFTSVNTVEIFFKKLLELKVSPNFSKIKIAAIGSKVFQALKKRNINIDLIPDEFISESLVKEFSKINLKGKKILLPCSDIAREVLFEELTKQEAIISQLKLYRTIKPDIENVELIINSIFKGEVEYITFTSPSTVSNFFEILKSFYNSNENVIELVKKLKVVCIGPTTGNKFKELFSLDCYIPEIHTTEGMLEIIGL